MRTSIWLNSSRIPVSISSMFVLFVTSSLHAKMRHPNAFASQATASAVVAVYIADHDITCTIKQATRSIMSKKG